MRNLECLILADDLTGLYPVSKRQIWRWLAHGCPSRLVGRKRLFKATAVEAWLRKYNSGDWTAYQHVPGAQFEPMVTGDGLLKLCPISRRQLYRWLKQGCPSRRVGHTRMFRPCAVEAWLTQFDQGVWTVNV